MDRCYPQQIRAALCYIICFCVHLLYSLVWWCSKNSLAGETRLLSFLLVSLLLSVDETRPIYFLKSFSLELVAPACSSRLMHGEEKRERKVHVNSKTFGRHRLSCSRDPTVLSLTHMCYPMLLAIWSHKRIKSGNCHLSWLRICTYLFLISQ